MMVVAVEQYTPQAQRLVHDELAYRLLPAGYQTLVRFMRWSPARKLLFKIAEKRGRGVRGGVLCRKRYIDDKLSQALSSGIQAVVNLGAGFDTRLYRQPGMPALPVFEVDLPQNIAYKERMLQQVFGKSPTHVQLVPVDFNNQELGSALQKYGYHSQMKTFFIWEAVTQYLEEPAVRKTFECLSQAQAGSLLVFTYIRQDFIDGSAIQGAEILYQGFRLKEQIWRFGLAPQKVSAFLNQYSWMELDHIGALEYTERYLRPCGRVLPVTEIERAVYARKIQMP